MTRQELLRYMRNIEQIPYKKLSSKKRTIYEAGRGERLIPSGHFYMDYAAFGGTSEEVPISLIRELLVEGILIPAFPHAKDVRVWILADP